MRRARFTNEHSGANLLIMEKAGKLIGVLALLTELDTRCCTHYTVDHWHSTPRTSSNISLSI
jgi:hypothetical protein